MTLIQRYIIMTDTQWFGMRQTFVYVSGLKHLLTCIYVFAFLMTSPRWNNHRWWRWYFSVDAIPFFFRIFHTQRFSFYFILWFFLMMMMMIRFFKVLKFSAAFWFLTSVKIFQLVFRSRRVLCSVFSRRFESLNIFFVVAFSSEFKRKYIYIIYPPSITHHRKEKFCKIYF